MALDINLIEDLGSLNIATPTILDKSPYLFRQTPSGAGNIVSPTIIGGSVGWNQLAEQSTSAWRLTNSSIAFANNIITLTKTTAITVLNVAKLKSSVLGHKYFVSAQIAAGSANTGNVRLGVFNEAGTTIVSIDNDTTTYVDASMIVTISNANEFIGLRRENAASVDSTGLYKNLVICDLTLALGSTIADYVYSLEQSTVGSGIAWLKKYGFLTKPYYAYDAGSIQSVKTTGRQTRNSNDEIIATYPTDDVELRGIPKLNASNELYYDGDVYEADGSVTRKYGIVDLGTLTWNYASNKSYFGADLAMKPIASWDIAPNMACAKYIATYPNNAITDAHADKVVSCNVAGSRLYACDSAYTDATAFKTAMSGVYLVYELATSTTESADPYTTPQIVGATEEFIDERTVPVPVGQESQYTQTQPYGLKIRLMEEGISIVNSSPLLRSASPSSPEPDTLTKTDDIGEVVKEPIKEIDEEPSIDTVKELPEDETEPEPEDEEVTEDDNEG